MEDTDYALGRTSAEYDRLTEQAELLRPITERMLRAAGICAGMHVLDVGCGVGDVSFLLSALVGPQGCVVASTSTETHSRSRKNGALRTHHCPAHANFQIMPAGSRA